MTDKDVNLISDPKMIIDHIKIIIFWESIKQSNRPRNKQYKWNKEPAEDQIYTTVELEVPEPS